MNTIRLSNKPIAWIATRIVVKWFGSLIWGIAWLTTSVAFADVVEYTVRVSEKTSIKFTLQGQVTKNPGDTTTYQHPKFGKIYFKSSEIDVIYVPTPAEKFARVMGAAATDASRLMDASRWALRNGLIKQCYQAIDKAESVDPSHGHVKLVRALQEKMKAEIPDSPDQEKELREFIGRSDMKIRKSKHFILMHDTPDKPMPYHKLSRAEERLILLETVYESFLLLFYTNGIELQVPKERMKVVLFEQYQDYLRFVKKLNPAMASALGFWSPTVNISVFFDHSTTEQSKALIELADSLQSKKNEAQKKREKGIGDLVRMADSLAQLVEIDHENDDISVVSHEATHQMAGNTNLFPRNLPIPLWVHEGLATYFETPSGASWAGPGAVNADRLDLYRILSRDREHSNIDFIVSDEIFDRAGDHRSRVHGYGQAWALTHFLMERHFKELMTYYRSLANLAPDKRANVATLQKMFRAAVPESTSALDLEWRKYMDSLKTDMELTKASKK